MTEAHEEEILTVVSIVFEANIINRIMLRLLGDNADKQHQKDYDKGEISCLPEPLFDRTTTLDVFVSEIVLVIGKEMLDMIEILLTGRRDHDAREVPVATGTSRAHREAGAHHVDRLLVVAE
jgi:hypothetical protein